MIICDKCGKENDDNRFICWDCGRELVNRNQGEQDEQSSETKNSCESEKTNNDSNQSKCPKCGHMIVPHARFCNKCGINLHSNSNSNSVFCSSCGEENHSTFEHCKKCGKLLSTCANSKSEVNTTQKKETGKTVLIWVIVVISILFVMGLTAVSYSLLSFSGYKHKEYRHQFIVPSDRVIVEELF